MPFSPELADIRFGCGLSPELNSPKSPLDLLSGLTKPDAMAERFPIDGFESVSEHVSDVRRLRQQQRNGGDSKAVREKIKKRNRAILGKSHRWLGNSLLRWSWSDTAFRERLCAFWADHFTAKGKVAMMSAAQAPYVEDAIRPNLSGSFGDLLIACTTHPLMLHFLDQAASVGPNSKAAQRKNRLNGLNENLAREVLELHTLGVGGPYGQEDVRQLAELFSGLSFNPEGGFRFRPAFSEPGAEIVMGKSYGGEAGQLEPVLRALRDLAVHPATARHIAGKLAVHFMSDSPDPGLIDHVAARFLDTGGNLMAVYSALVEHPSVWERNLANVKPPFDFIASSCRALAVQPRDVSDLKLRDIRRSLVRPLNAMGQPWLRPDGPDGWAEEDSAWITPQGVSARLRWAMAAPSVLRPDLPDPRQFVGAALGAYANGIVRFAAEAAESKPEAIGLVLASPAFQRR